MGAYEYCSTITSVKDMGHINYDENISIFPNPTQGSFTIESGELIIIDKVTIHNALGQQVEITRGNNVNISSLSKGVYLLKIVFNSGRTACRKVVKH